MKPLTCSHGNRWVRMTLTMEMASDVSRRPGFVIRKTNKVAPSKIPAPTIRIGRDIGARRNIRAMPIGISAYS